MINELPNQKHTKAIVKTEQYELFEQESDNLLIRKTRSESLQNVSKPKFKQLCEGFGSHDFRIPTLNYMAAAM